MIKWNENLKKAPTAPNPIIVKVNHGLFSGGWQWHKALKVGDSFFYFESKKPINDVHSWAKVDI